MWFLTRGRRRPSGRRLSQKQKRSWRQVQHSLCQSGIRLNDTRRQIDETKISGQRGSSSTRLALAHPDPQDAGWSPVHLRRPHHRAEQQGAEGRVGLQQRRLCRPGLCAKPPTRTNRHLLQRSLQRSHPLHCLCSKLAFAMPGWRGEGGRQQARVGMGNTTWRLGYP